MANRNRTAGHNYERQVTRELNDMGYQMVTARSESRNADNSGIDILGDFPFYIQCKVMEKYPKLNELINNKRERFLDRSIIVFHKKVRKAKSRFTTEEEFVTMTKADFYKLIAECQEKSLKKNTQ